MQFAQKKQYRNNYPRKNQQDLDRWDHGGYEQLQQEQDNRHNHYDKGNRSHKYNRYNNDNTMASENYRDDRSDKRNPNSMKKWAHVSMYNLKMLISLG